MPEGWAARRAAASTTTGPMAPAARHGRASPANRTVRTSRRWATQQIAARVLATIVNEAASAVADGVGTPEAIDTAMRLGTNYPSGPLEWGERIGLDHVIHTMDASARLGARRPLSGRCRCCASSPRAGAASSHGPRDRAAAGSVSGRRLRHGWPAAGHRGCSGSEPRTEPLRGATARPSSAWRTSWRSSAPAAEHYRRVLRRTPRACQRERGPALVDELARAQMQTELQVQVAGRPGAIELVERLRGRTRLGLASNSPRQPRRRGPGDRAAGGCVRRHRHL